MGTLLLWMTTGFMVTEISLPGNLNEWNHKLSARLDVDVLYRGRQPDDTAVLTDPAQNPRVLWVDHITVKDGSHWADKLITSFSASHIVSDTSQGLYHMAE